MAVDILIVDDEKDICDLIAGILEDEGFEARQATSSEAALEEVQKRAPNLVILDVWLQGSGMDGLSLLRYLKAMDDSLPVIIISGHGSFDTALAAINRGAYDYLEKPFKADQLLLIVRRAIELTQLKSENTALKTARQTNDQWVGSGTIANRIREEIGRLANTNSRIIISGEKGVGKRLVARLIHQNSNRASGPFIVIDQASLDNQDIETLLFGCENNNGTIQTIGLFERAHKGTAVLSCLPDLPMGTQKQILKILTEGRFKRKHGNTYVHIDTRVLATTTCDLTQEIESGHVSRDLVARLDVAQLSIPPLSKRQSDIPDLVSYFVDDIAIKTGLNVRRFSAEALAIIQSMNWQGNIRQLRNFVERILILSPNELSSEISTAELQTESLGEISQLSSKNGDLTDIIGLSLRDAREQFERNYLRLQISRFNGNVSKTAAFIGMERSALHRKMKSLGINQ